MTFDYFIEGFCRIVNLKSFFIFRVIFLEKLKKVKNRKPRQ